MYKDPEKQKEANRRIKERKRKGVTSEGVTIPDGGKGVTLGTKGVTSGPDKNPKATIFAKGAVAIVQGMTGYEALNPRVAEAIEMECLARRRKGLIDDREARYVRALRYQREQSGEVISVSEIMRSNLIGVEKLVLKRMIGTFQESSHPEYMCDVRLGVFGPTLDVLAEV